MQIQQNKGEVALVFRVIPRKHADAMFTNLLFVSTKRTVIILLVTHIKGIYFVCASQQQYHA